MCHLSESQIKLMTQMARIIACIVADQHLRARTASRLGSLSHCGKGIPLLMRGCVESYL